MDFIVGLGRRGDVVEVGKSLARNKLLPGGLAVYDSPEHDHLRRKVRNLHHIDLQGTVGFYVRMVIMVEQIFYVK